MIVVSDRSTQYPCGHPITPPGPGLVSVLGYYREVRCDQCRQGWGVVNINESPIGVDHVEIDPLDVLPPKEAPTSRNSGRWSNGAWIQTNFPEGPTPRKRRWWKRHAKPRT